MKLEKIKHSISVSYTLTTREYLTSFLFVKPNLKLVGIILLFTSLINFAIGIPTMSSSGIPLVIMLMLALMSFVITTIYTSIGVLLFVFLFYILALGVVLLKKSYAKKITFTMNKKCITFKTSTYGLEYPAGVITNVRVDKKFVVIDMKNTNRRVLVVPKRAFTKEQLHLLS